MTDEGRALLTTREKEILAGEREVSDNYRYKVESTVRNRIRNHLGEDLTFLATHFPEAHELAMTEVEEVSDDE
jgi:hypothetical protein